jgi:hypothetical protein
VRSVLLLVLPALALLTLVTQAQGQSREVTGQTGLLGEWELAATVTQRDADGITEFIGPLTLKHVGICTQDGPEEKAGELRLRLSDSLSRVRATLLIDGTECSFNGTRTTSFEGWMNCPDRRSVPLTLWIK